MLDAATMALLAKLKILAKKSGTNVDLVLMSSDRAYAESVLKELSNADDAELVLIVIQLMSLFGMISAPAAHSKPEDKPEMDRYVGRLR